jgi:hypothetical protein
MKAEPPACMVCAKGAIRAGVCTLNLDPDDRSCQDFLFDTHGSRLAGIHACPPKCKKGEPACVYGCAKREFRDTI